MARGEIEENQAFNKGGGKGVTFRRGQEGGGGLKTLSHEDSGNQNWYLSIIPEGKDRGAQARWRKQDEGISSNKKKPLEE